MAPGVESLPASQAAPAGPVRSRQFLQERFLLLVVMVVAGVSASFVARNSDVWLHRATGRLLAQGQYHFGTDPFGQDTAGRYWANHAWLYDWGLYILWEQGGEKMVMAIKAGLVSLLALLLWQISRRWVGVWLAAVLTLLGIVAISPRLLLQPLLLSLLGLVAVLWCCQRSGRWLWGIPLLTALWVNLDSWFFLGPLAMLLEVLRPRQPGEQGRPWGVFAATGIASLCSPHHWRAWTWPVELSPAVWWYGWPSDPRLAGVFAAPWSGWVLSRGDIPLAGVAFLLLLVSWLLAVVAAIRRRQWHVTLLLGLLLCPLALWQARLVPLWTVASIPLIAQHLGRLLAAWQSARGPFWLTTLAALTYLALMIPGGIAGRWLGDRDGLSWRIYEHPTLRHLAATVQKWHASHPDAPPLFTTHPDVAHYLAWFAPEVRSSYDFRLTLFADRASWVRHSAGQLGLVTIPAPSSVEQQTVLTAGMAAVLYDPDRGRWSAALEQVYKSRSEWRPVQVAGSALLLLRAPASAEDWQSLLRRDWQDPQLQPSGDGPLSLALPKPWWHWSWRRGRSGSWQADAASVYLRLHELLPVETADPRAALLALRAARSGLERDPADALAWLLAGRAVDLLQRHPWESASPFPPLQQLRQAQYRAALLQAVRHQPELLAAQEALSFSLLELPAWDVAWDHAQKVLRLQQRAGPVAGETVSAFQQRCAQWQELAAQIERQLRDNENRFVLRSSGLAGQPLARARLAAQLGLYETALEILQSSSAELYGPEGVVLLLELLVQTGRIAEARILLDRDELRRQPLSLGLYEVPLAMTSRQQTRLRTYQLPAYLWFDLVTAAAAGHYRQAQQTAEAIRRFLQEEWERLLPAALTVAFAQAVGSEIALAAPLSGLPAFRWLGHWKTARLTQAYERSLTLRIASGDFALLSTLLALESGEFPLAQRVLTEALRGYHEGEANGSEYPGLRLLEHYRKLLP
jgi:tetratricopeptide (TPR) repeat protein